MQLKNHTIVPSETVRVIVRFVCPPGVRMFGLTVKSARHGIVRGRARITANCVNLYIGDITRFPTSPIEENRRRKGGYLPVPWFASQAEALVYITAHELRHLWQKRVPKGYRVWGSRGQYSERDADAYAIRMLRAWRKR